jgi:hypothetical protein
VQETWNYAEIPAELDNKIIIDSLFASPPASIKIINHETHEIHEN